MFSPFFSSYDSNQNIEHSKMSLENSLGVILEDGAEISPASVHDPIEYFFASCSIPIIHHTNRIIQLENYDIASVKNGELSIHRLRGSDPGDLVR